MYIYRNKDQKEIDQICSTNNTGYADLWMKKDVSFRDKISQFRNIRIKKMIKKLLGYN
jgi:5-methylthioribose kinase